MCTVIEASALEAGALGLLGGSGLLIGAAAGYWLRLPQKAIAYAVAFASGVLIGFLAFDLMPEAVQTGGLGATVIGFAAGAFIFTMCNVLIVRAGGQHRKRSGCDPCAAQSSVAGLAIAAGALLDGVPESFVIGVTTLDGSHAAVLAVSAFFLANVPEGLSSAAGMRVAGHGSRFVLGVWALIALASAAAAIMGHFALASAAPQVIAASLGVASGAIVAMLVDTLIPEAAAEAHEYTGLITASGLLLVFILAS